MRIVAALLTALGAALAAPAMAQDIPGRVGRVAYIEGNAAVYMDQDEGWEKAYVNSPITSENSLWTDPDSRAEVRVGGTAVRLNEATQLDIARLDDDHFEAYVPRGTVAVRVRHHENGRDLVFDTPHARFSLRADGRYRIDVDPDLEESRVTVFAGDARVGSDSGAVRASAGQTVRVFGGERSSYVVERAYNDPFDKWAQQRDAKWVETRSVRYVSPDMTGYEDLDSYGNWSEEPEYGALWYPTRVEADWAPYRYGRWDYVRPWGWTWVDDSPWGYAPFHYGRWVNVRNRWAWLPGKREVRPVWAPALVAWIGGSNFNVSVSSGPSVGWYPLSPWDRYQPWYKASPTYINRVNVVVINNPRKDQVQWRQYNRDRGATVVSRDAVIDRRPVQQARVNVRPEALAAAAAVATTAAAVLPSRNEVVQRRVTQRTQQATRQPAGPAPRAGQPTVAGPNNNPAARPEFKPRTAAVNSTPRRAAAAPAPARPVTTPSASATVRQERATQQREAQQRTPPASPATREAPQRTPSAASPTTRETPQQAREAQQKQQQQAREAQQNQQREAQQKQQQQTREAQQTQQREAQQKQQQQAREAQQTQQREAQQKQQQQAREAQQTQQREAQQKQQQQTREAQQNQQREAQQKQQQQAREAQQNSQREAQQKQQQQAREAQQNQQREAQQKQQQQQAREAQQNQQREAQQKQQQAREAQQNQQREAQQKQQQAREAQQNQQREAQQKQQQAREAQQQQQAAERAQRAQPQQQQQPQTRAKPAPREEKEKEKDDDDKKGRSR